MISEDVIDRINILEATFLAMNNAVSQLISQLPKELNTQADFSKKVLLMVDGNRFKSDLPYASKTLVDGDALCLSIAAASIVAKVTRDRIINVYDQIFPLYGFKQHKGYPTQSHKKAIAEHGLSLVHRKTFRFA